MTDPSLKTVIIIKAQKRSIVKIYNEEAYIGKHKTLIRSKY